jgi:hypothetical protein
MVQKFVLLFAIVCFPLTVLAEGKEDVSIQEEEIIVKKAELAVHMGIADQEIIFGTPRSFRSKAMDQVAIEPMEANTEENSGS